MRVVALLALAALPAIAQAPAFLSSAPLEISGGDALHRATLPFEAYRDARLDLADVRIVNAGGEQVPYAWAGDLDPVRDAAAPIVLPLFALARAQTETSVGDEVTVRTQDGTLIAVRSRRIVKSPPRAAAYLLDASQVKPAISALSFSWNAGPGTEVVTLRIEASEDLKAWSPVATGPVVKVEGSGRFLTQPRVEFAPRQSKYYRVRWDAPTFALAEVRAEPAATTKPAPRLARMATGTAGPKPGEVIFDLGARLPVEAVRIVPADTNAVLSVTLFARNDPEQPWRMVANAPFYRLSREGGEVHSPAIEIGKHPARYWMARMEAGSSKGPPPALEAQWRSAQLVFVARGARPFSIAFGKGASTPGALPLTTVMPNYERGMEMRLSEAKVGAVASGPPPTRWDRLVGEINAKRLALWAILLAGVAFLGFMAWRLTRAK